MKSVKAPNSNSASMLSFYTSLDNISLQDNEAVASTASTSAGQSGQWALLDTGASHHMFNDESMFVASSLVPHDNPSQRLKLARGGVSLAVKSTGVVQLKAGDGTVFTLNDCLLVPELSKNLISGGALFKSHAVPIVHQGQTDNFSVVKDNLAVFNGAFVGNLMLLALDKVSSYSSQCNKSNIANYASCGSLQHQRLGHVSERTVTHMPKDQIASNMLPSFKSICDIYRL